MLVFCCGLYLNKQHLRFCLGIETGLSFANNSSSEKFRDYKLWVDIVWQVFLFIHYFDNYGA